MVYGNALDERVLLRSQMDTRRAALAVTPNEAVNLLFVRAARQEAHVPVVYAVGVRSGPEISVEHFHDAKARLLFASETDPELWSVRIRRGLTAVEAWRRVDDSAGDSPELPNEQVSLLLPLFLVDGQDRIEPVDETRRFAKGRTVLWLMQAERGDEARAWLTAQGWNAAPAEATEADTGPEQSR